MPVYTKEHAEAVRYYLEHERLGELEFIDGYARKTGGPVLELASGAARVSSQLARRGHVVYGVEMSRPMLDKAREVLGDEAPEVRGRVHLVQGDMTRFAFGRQFPLIIIPFNSFWYNLYENRAQECVRCIVSHLAPGGFFLVEGEGKGDYFAFHSETAVFWGPIAKRLGFRYRFERYRQEHFYKNPSHSFLVGWRP